MSQDEVERFARKLRADAVLESAARQLQDILIALAHEADSLFPYFADSDLRLIEVEPGANAGADMGFVALCPDGLLYDLSVGLDFDPFASGRRHSLRELNLASHEYVPYAYNAICQVVAMLANAAKEENSSEGQ